MWHHLRERGRILWLLWHAQFLQLRRHHHPHTGNHHHSRLFPGTGQAVCFHQLPSIGESAIIFAMSLSGVCVFFLSAFILYHALFLACYNMYYSTIGLYFNPYCVIKNFLRFLWKAVNNFKEIDKNHWFMFFALRIFIFYPLFYFRCS